MSQVTAPTDYVIRTRFDVGSVPGLPAITGQVQALDSKISALGGNLTGKLLGAFAAIASVTGITSLTKQVVGLNSEIENAQFGIASLFSSINKMPMDRALNAAGDVLKRLRADAAKGVGEFTDYNTSFQQIYGAASSKGASLDQTLEIVRLTQAMGFGSGRGSAGVRLANIDIVQALQNKANGQTRMLNQTLEAAGISTKEFNASQGTARIQLLLKGLGTLKEAADAFGRTWDARLGTFKDHLRSVALTVSGGLFQSWSDGLADVNDWLEKNSTLVNDISRKVGRGLMGAQGNLQANAGNLATAGASVVGASIGARTAAGAAGALGVGGGAALAVAAAAAYVFGTLTAAVTSAARRWPEYAATLGASLGNLGRSLTGFVESVAGLASTTPLQFLGLFIIDVATKFTNVVSKVVDGITLLVDVLHFATDAVTERIWSLWHSMRGHEDQRLKHRSLGAQAENNLFAVMQEYATGGGKLGAYVNGKLPLKYDSYFGQYADNKDRKFDLAPNFNFNGDITIKVEAERLDDPNTVAVTFEKAMARLQQFPEVEPRRPDSAQVPVR